MGDFPEGNRNYWADQAYQLGGSQEYYDRVLKIEDPGEAEKEYNLCKQEKDSSLSDWPEGNRNYWADQAYQLGGSQEYYDRVLKVDDPNAALAEYTRCKGSFESETAVLVKTKNKEACCVVQ